MLPELEQLPCIVLPLWQAGLATDRPT